MCPHCENTPADQPKPARPDPQRVRLHAGMLLPGVLAVLTPKCPACLAAYIALFTGVSLSTGTARQLQFGLVAACIVSTATVLWRKVK